MNFMGPETLPSDCYIRSDESSILFYSISNGYKMEKEEGYSRVPRLSDTSYSAKGTKGKWRYATSKYGYVGGRQI